MYFILTGSTIEIESNRSALLNFADFTHLQFQSGSHYQPTQPKRCIRFRSGGMSRSSSKASHSQSASNTTIPMLETSSLAGPLPFGWVPFMTLDLPLASQSNTDNGVTIVQRSSDDLHAIVYLIK